MRNGPARTPAPPILPIYPHQTDRMHSSELLPVVVRRRAFTIVARVSKKVHDLSEIVDRANVFESVTYMNCTRGEKNPKRFLGQIENANRFSIVERLLHHRKVILKSLAQFLAPKGQCPPAQGCARRRYPGNIAKFVEQPRRGCVLIELTALSHNPAWG